MSAVARKLVAADPPALHEPTRRHLRGSGLLLGGRMLSIGMNFVAQMLVVRYLSTKDYGTLAYALAAVAFFDGISTLGLKNSLTRFAPIYHENRDYARLFGLLAMALLTILIMGTLIVGLFYAFPEQFMRLVHDRDRGHPMQLLLIMIFLVPVEALDGLLVGLFASFARPRAIFFRKHVVGPALKLGVVVLLIALGADVVFVAYGYLTASLLGVLIFSWVLLRHMRERGLLSHFEAAKLRLPFREVFAFTIPILTTDLVNIVMHSVDTLLLGYFHDTTEVARYRAVLPAAHLNTVVMSTFALLYTPLAARLFARQDHAGIQALYWRTALWMSVLSFPVFALTFCLAKPLTVTLYGERYADSWIIMQMLSLAYYFNVALGFNGLTLKVLGKLRYVVLVNMSAVVVNLVLDLLLVPRYGALGAGMATAGAMAIHNVLKQAGLRLATGPGLFEWKYLSFYLIVGASATGLLLLQGIVPHSIWLSVPLAAVVSLALLVLTRDSLRIEETFPEMLRIPVLGSLLRWTGGIGRA